MRWVSGTKDRDGAARSAPSRENTHDGIAISEVAEDGEVNGVDADEYDGETDDRTHPVGPALREGENKGADRKKKTADERSVESSFGPSSAHVGFVQALLVEVAGKADRGSQTGARNISNSVTSRPASGASDAHESVECQPGFALVEAVLESDWSMSLLPIKANDQPNQNARTTFLKMSGTASAVAGTVNQQILTSAPEIRAHRLGGKRFRT